MKKDLGIKGYLYPQCVAIISTYDEIGNEDVMNAAWCAMADYDKLFICLGEHKTTENILKNKALVVSIGVKDYAVNEDFVGVVSLNKDPEKIKKSGFSFTKSKFVNAPLINELPLALECELISYDKDTGYLFAKIINTSADEKILKNDDKIDVLKLNPISYDPSNHKYYALNEEVGTAFKDGFKLK